MALHVIVTAIALLPVWIADIVNVPFQFGGTLHYYWLAHFLSSVEYRVLGPWGLTIEEIALANSLAYGLAFGPPLARRDPLVKATASLGLALILLGAMSWIWSDKARSMILPSN